MTKLYIDTNVIIDAVEGRKNLMGTDIAALAWNLFKEAISCKYHLVISTFTLYELRKRCKADVTLFFAMIKKKQINIVHDEIDEEKARQLDTNNFDDALHVILAEKSGADYIITRNTKDFNTMQTKIPIKKPENLI